MKQELALLDKLDAEHNELMRDAQNLEHKTNDLDAIMDLKKASEDFILWSIDLCKQILQYLQRSLEGGTSPWQGISGTGKIHRGSGRRCGG